jgi:hypothetical protein
MKKMISILLLASTLPLLNGCADMNASAAQATNDTLNTAIGHSFDNVNQSIRDN